MALIECPDCMTKVSARATACPSCGFPVRAQVARDAMVSAGNDAKNAANLVGNAMKASAGSQIAQAAFLIAGVFLACASYYMSPTSLGSTVSNLSLAEVVLTLLLGVVFSYALIGRVALWIPFGVLCTDVTAQYMAIFASTVLPGYLNYIEHARRAALAFLIEYAMLGAFISFAYRRHIAATRPIWTGVAVCLVIGILPAAVAYFSGLEHQAFFDEINAMSTEARSEHNGTRERFLRENKHSDVVHLLLPFKYLFVVIAGIYLNRSSGQRSCAQSTPSQESETSTAA